MVRLIGFTSQIVSSRGIVPSGWAAEVVLWGEKEVGTLAERDILSSIADGYRQFVSLLETSDLYSTWEPPADLAC